MKKIYKFLICAVVIFSLTAIPSFAEAEEVNRNNYVYTVMQTQTAEVSDGTYIYFDLPFGMYVSHHIVSFTFPSLVSGYGDILFEGLGVESFEADGNGTEIRNTACGLALWLYADTPREVTVTVTTYMVGTYADGYKAYEKDIGSYLISEDYGVSGMPEPLEGNPSAFLDWFSSVNYEEGIDRGYKQCLEESKALIEQKYWQGYNEGYQDSYKDLYEQLHTGIKDTMDKAENSIDEKAEGSFIQGFLAGMWNGVTAFISMILTGVTFSDLSLMNILATAIAILTAAFIIKMISG